MSISELAKQLGRDVKNVQAGHTPAFLCLPLLRVKVGRSPFTLTLMRL